MVDFDKYVLAAENGLLDKLKGDEIANRIAKECPRSEETALLKDMVHALITASLENKKLKHCHSFKETEWMKDYERRERIKAEVDREFKELEKRHKRNNK